MLVHSVFFWLKKDSSKSDLLAFRQGLETLTKITSAEAVYVGTPAATAPRPVVDASYDFALTVLLKDVDAHDAYQADPIHLSFVEQFKPKWERVQIYDAS
jgi:hypothetical protein